MIYENHNLSTCEVLSICDFLDIPNSSAAIYDNASGCNNRTEVEQACGLIGIQDIIKQSDFSIYPNPAEKEISLYCKNGTTIKEINIYNRIGQKVLHKKQIPDIIDVSGLRPGMYIVELISSELKIRKKLIIR